MYKKHLPKLSMTAWIAPFKIIMLFRSEVIGNGEDTMITGYLILNFFVVAANLDLTLIVRSGVECVWSSWD